MILYSARLEKTNATPIQHSTLSLQKCIQLSLKKSYETNKTIAYRNPIPKEALRKSKNFSMPKKFLFSPINESHGDLFPF